jgi:arsenate reductase
LGGHGTLPTTREGGPQRTVPSAAAAKKRVLFVCIGNSCRSQMAEAFARAYGRDVMDAHSAGLSPATIIAPLTQLVLKEKNVTVDGQFPKGLDMMARVPFDLVVNMSGAKVALPGARMIEWPVVDPIGQKDEVYRAVAERIEGLVMRLIIELRAVPR